MNLVALSAEPKKARRDMDALPRVEIMKAQKRAHRGAGGNPKLTEQTEEVLVAGSAKRGDSDIELLSVGRSVGVRIASQAGLLLKQRHLELPTQKVAGD